MHAPPTLVSRFRMFAAAALLPGLFAVVQGESIRSPDGGVVATLSAAGGRLSYSVQAHGQPAIEPSPLGILANGDNLGDGAAIVGSTFSHEDTEFASRHGIHATGVNRCNVGVFTIRHRKTGTIYRLEVRVFDDGVAFRYEIDGIRPEAIEGEATAFRLPRGSIVWHQSSVAAYDRFHEGTEVAALPDGWPMGPPVVVELPSRAGFVAITQSFLGAFGSPYLVKDAESDTLLRVAHPKNADGAIVGATDGPTQFPWQVILVARTLDALVNSDIVESLAPPPDPALFPDAAARAETGRSVWDWLSPFPLGNTQRNAMLNSYWASKMGFEYNTLDEGWEEWSRQGKPLEEVTDHARRLGVNVLVYVDAKRLSTAAERRDFFTRLRDAGVRGVKVNFLDPNPSNAATAERMEWIDSILRDAAAFELVVILHGSPKPTGQFRTYPNLVGWKAISSMQEHPSVSQTVPLPFTRFLAGPGDYAPVDLSGSQRSSLDLRTPAYELATAIAMASPVLTFAERSDRIAKSPFAGFLRSIPPVWDETRVLPQSELGRTVVMARRSGRSWFVGAMNADEQRSWKLPLDFLDAGQIYQAEIVRDGSRTVEHRLVTRADSLPATAAPGGGFVARIHPPHPPLTALPFATAFNPGYGERFFAGGVPIKDGRWIENAVADAPPTWRWRLEGDGSKHLRATLDMQDAYFGAASLRVGGTLDGESLLRLFSTRMPVEANTRVRLVTRRGAANMEMGVKLALAFDDAPDVFEDFEIGPASTSGWNVAEIDIGASAGRRIAEIGLRFGADGAVADYSIQIGELVVHNGPIEAPAPPSALRVTQREALDADSVRLWLEWNSSPSPVRFYNVCLRRPDGSREWLGASDGTSAFVDTIRRRETESEIEIQVEAVGPDFGVSSPVSATVDLPSLPNLNHLLTGAVIGSPGSWNGNGHTREKAFDGNVATYFDGPGEDDSWTGLDLGVHGERTITGIRYCPRLRWAERMVGGIFQGANNEDFSDAVLLGTIPSVPDEGSFSTMTVNSPERFRYLRYLSPRSGWANVAEIQFYGVDLAGGTPSALASGGTRVPMQSAHSSGGQEPAELDQAIDGKDAGPVGWLVRPGGRGPESLVVRAAKSVQAQSFDLVLCFLSGRPGCYPVEFALAYTSDAEPSLDGRWTRVIPERVTATGPALRVTKDVRMLTSGTAGVARDAIFQIRMRAPEEPVTGFRIDVFPVRGDEGDPEPAMSWSRTRDVRLTEFRANANHSSTTNLALGRPVKASHAVWKESSESALTDGLPGSFVHPADPGVGNAFFFEIDLGRAHRIDHIALRGRADGYGADRMSRVKVELFEDDPDEGTVPTWTSLLRADGSHPKPGGVDVLRPADGEGTCRGRYLRISSDSAVSFSPQLAEVEVYGSLRPHVTAMEADGKSLPADGTAKVPAGTRLLSVDFGVSGTNPPDQLPIRWRLEGLHDDWQTTRDLSAQVKDPPPGSYVLEAEVGHTDGEWDAERLAVPVVVARPFWERPAFFVPVGAAALGALLLAGRRARRLREERREAVRRHKSALAEERTRIARNMHDEVGARLSQIAMMQDLVVRRHELPAAAREELRELSSNTRSAVDALDQAVWAVNPTNDSLPGVVEYLSHTATNYLRPLQISCRLDVAMDWPAVDVRAQVRHQLVLAFQEALQNIVKHSGATMVTLGIRYDAAQLSVQLTDNGRGFDGKGDGDGHDGIANMRARLASIGGTLSIRADESSGVDVEMRIPL